MKSTKIIVAMMASIILVTGCKRENKYLQSPDNKQQSGTANKIEPGVDGDGFLLTQPILRFTWRGVDHDGQPLGACLGGPCGICFGMCVIWKAVLYDPRIGLTKEERKEGLGTAKIKVVENNLYMRPDASCDNGDGTVNITDNYNLGAEIARLLNRSSVVIKKGIYSIRYTKQLPFGEVIFELLSDKSQPK